MKKLLLFDYDGVIVDSLETITDVYNQLFEKHGLALAFTPQGFSRLYVSNLHASLAKLVPEGILKKIIVEKTEHFIRRSREMRVFDGIVPVLRQLAKNNIMMIVTSNNTDVVKENLKKNNIDIFRDVIGGDIEKSKTKKILAQKAEFPAAECYYVGDTVGDIREGKQAGIKTVAAAWGYHNRGLLEKERPDMILARPEELLQLL